MQSIALRPICFDQYYYTSVYRDYQKQTPAAKLAFYQGLLTSALGSVQARARILDVGCAFGDFLAQAPSDWDRVGSDLNAYAVDLARSRNPGIAFHDGGLPPLSAGIFDAITAFDVLEHIPEVKATVDEIHARLKPGGIFLFVVPVYDGPLGWVVHTLDKDPTHIHKWSRQAWLSFMGQQFDILEWTGIVRWMPPIGGYIHVPSRILRDISPGIAVVCRRR